MTNVSVALPAVLALALLSGCAPRAFVKYEVPPKVHFEGERVAINAVGYKSDWGALAMLDPKFWTGDTDSHVSSAAAQHLEQVVVNERLLTALPGCTAPCPAADALLFVKAWVEFVNGKPVGAGLPPRAGTVSAMVQVTVVNPRGEALYEGSYKGEGVASTQGQSGGAAPEQETTELFQIAAFNAVDRFADDLRVKEDSWIFILEAEGALKPGVERLMDDDLDGAWTAFREVLAKEPNNAAALYDLGAVMTLKGELEAARDAFAAATRLDAHYGPQLEQAERRLQYRDALRARPRR
jgi:tetratricopeptide (TPR) repeat protein